MPTALIVDQDMEVLLSLAEVFRVRGYSVETATDLRQARSALVKKMPEVALLNENVSGECSFDLLEQVDLSDVVEIYLMSASRSVASASRAMRIGVADYLNIPVDRKHLGASLDSISSGPGNEVTGDTVSKSARGLLIGETAPMKRLYRLIRKCAPSDASILISGESGVGKELVAQTIHELSNRAKQKMIAVNCSAIPSELMESELFGHRKGSFTGATKNHRGFFERASGSTLFLDEVTEMDAALQTKLLRVLEVNKVRPIGSEKDIEVDARIIAASNQDAVEAVEKGQLREDLYYRLAQFPLYVAPLRDKSDDVDLLAEHFLLQQNLSTGVEKTFAPEVIDAFKVHDWPGNVRELKNAVIHGHLLAGDTILRDDLPDAVPSSMPSTGEYVRISVGTPLAEVERRHVLSTLAHFEGDKKKTAGALGVSLKTLYNRLNKYEAKKARPSGID